MPDSGVLHSCPVCTRDTVRKTLPDGVALTFVEKECVSTVDTLQLVYESVKDTKALRILFGFIENSVEGCLGGLGPECEEIVLRSDESDEVDDSAELDKFMPSWN